MKKFLGWLCLLSPVILAFIAIATVMNILTALIVFGIALVATGLIILGLYLINGG
jgi:hypothetical protein